MDRLTNMPDNVIDNILERLALRDTIRMSALSKDWKEKWSSLPTLVLDAKVDCDKYSCTTRFVNYYLNVATLYMSRHIGVILEASVHITPELCSSNEDRRGIEESIRLVSSKGTLKKLMLENNDIPHVYKLPIEVFSCTLLTSLKLKGPFNFDPPRNCFPNLSTLILCKIKFPLDRISTIISDLPRLQRVTLDVYGLEEDLRIYGPKLEYIYVSGEFKSISLKETHSAASVLLHLEDLDIGTKQATHCNILNLSDNLGKVENLVMGGYMCKILGVNFKIPKKLSSTLNALKILGIKLVNLDDIEEFSTALCLIASVPNLSKLELSIHKVIMEAEETKFSSVVDEYHDCFLNNLRTVELRSIFGTFPQKKMIEFLLGHSPALGVMSISFRKDVSGWNKSIISQCIQQFWRASPKVDMKVY